jgi:serpin B
MKTCRHRKGVILIGLLGLLLAAGLSAANWNTVVDRIPLLGGVDPGLVNANNQFALDLYAQLAKDSPRDKIFFSPLSISAILAQAYAGARGNTAREMKAALHFDLEPDQLHPAMGALLKHLEQIGGQGGNELSIANALWLDQNFQLLPAFAALCRDHYSAVPHILDFMHAAAAQRQIINDWVEEHTRGKISDLMPPGSLNSDTRLVLTNAVYFDGHWESVFQPDNTWDEAFTAAGKQSVKVPMMRQVGKFNYMGEQDLQMLEMPYVGREVSMLILLPREVDGLADLEKDLTAKGVADRIGRLQEQKVRIFLPRFEMKAGYQLNPTLETLGMREAFSRKTADFSGMGNAPLFIDLVVHKAFIEVNEKGTKAAAASGAKAAKSKPSHEPPVFRADHPFIFLIRDMRSGSILFLGRVMNPKAEGV